MQLNKSFLTSFLAPLFVFSMAHAQDSSNTGSTSSTFPKPTRTAEETLKPHVGLLAGSAAPEGSGHSSTGAIGVDFGFQPYIPFGVGGEISYYKAPGTGTNSDLERTQILAKGSYNFGGQYAVIKHSYVGVGAGTMIENQTALLALVPMVGFDIPVTRMETTEISLGANARYALIEGSTPDALSVNGALKVWY